MSQSGEAREPEHPPVDGPAAPEGRGFLVAGIVVLVAVVALLAALAHGDDALDQVAREEARFPSPPTTTLPAAPVSSAPVTPSPTAAPSAAPSVAPSAPASSATTTTAAPTTPPTTTPPTTAPTTSPPPTPGPTTTVAAGVPATPDSTAPDTSGPDSTPDAPPYVAQLVPSVAAHTGPLTPEAAAAAIQEILATGRHDIAAPGPTVAICAAVPLAQPLALDGRWERDGHRVATSGTMRREPPGFGECLDDDGEALAPGAYQYIVRDTGGHESAAGGIVLGAATAAQPFVNDGATAVCTIRIAPATARYFESYVYLAAPIAPGAAVTLTVAGVEQDVETLACDGSRLASFSFLPDAARVQPLDP